MSTEINFDELKNRWDKYDNLLRRLGDGNLNKLLDDLSERLLMCPSSPRTDQPGCFPGGLIDHALRVTATMRTLDKAHGSGLETNSIIKVGLLHELGKVGDLKLRYFVEQDSSWHREKLGQLYKFNESLNKMSVSHRTLWLLQHYGVVLSNDEWLAIQLAPGSHFEENRFYVGFEPTLSLLLQHAKAMVAHIDRKGSKQGQTDEATQ